MHNACFDKIVTVPILYDYIKYFRMSKKRKQKQKEMRNERVKKLKLEYEQCAKALKQVKETYLKWDYNKISL